MNSLPRSDCLIRTVAVTLCTMCPALLPCPLLAQERGIGVEGASEDGVIEIVEPSAWRGVEPRGFTVATRRSIRVIGRAYHPSGVNGVLVNGDRAALQALGDGLVRFVGFANVERDTDEVEVAAFTDDGRTFLRRFDVQPEPAEQVYETPEQAWSEEVRFPGKRWAVVVGISEYDDGRIPPLRFADRDARAFYDFLISERAGLGGFPPQNVVLLLNQDATYRNLRTALFGFLREATEDDQVVIYFAGHGVPDPERIQDLYLLTYDARVDNLSGTAFPMADVAEATRAVLARDIVVITDACHSAGVGGQVAAMRDIGANQVNRLFLQELNASVGGLTIFTASQAAQVSFEGEEWGGGHGIFTHHLLEALNGAADEDRDRIVTLGEMMEYTRERVRRETRNAQIPTISQTTFDQALPMAAVLDPGVYERLAQERAADEQVALPSMFATPEPARDVPRYDGREALIRGLTLPGMGMFYVDEPGMGALYAAASVAGFFGTWLFMEWRYNVWWDQCDGDPDCEFSGPWLASAELGPRLITGGLVAGATWVIGALHSRAVADRKNAAADALRRSSIGLELPNGARLAAPAMRAGLHGAVDVDLFRVKF